MKKLLGNVTKGIILTMIGLILVIIDVFFFFFIRLLNIEPISLAAFISILVVSLALFLLDENSILEWVKKKLNDT